MGSLNSFNSKYFKHYIKTNFYNQALNSLIISDIVKTLNKKSLYFIIKW